MSCKSNLQLTFLLVPQRTILAMRRAVAIVAVSILIGLATAVAAAPPPQSVVSKIFANPKPGVVEEIDRKLKDLASKDEFSGVLVLAKGNQVLFQGAYGMASREYRVPNTVGTRLNLASVGKMFTTAAIGKLVDMGKISYNDLIGKYLGPEWISPEIGRKVTIEHLLTHRSGLDTYFTEEWQRSSKTLYRNIEDYKPLVASSKLLFEPGTSENYSNNGFLLLGVIIEKVTGQPYEEFVRNAVFKPAGMTDTDWMDLEEVNTNYAQGYMKAPRKPPVEVPGPPGEPPAERIKRAQAAEKKAIEEFGVIIANNIFTHSMRGGPAGGGFSTANDLLRYFSAMESGRIVSPSLFQTITTVRPDGQRYNYGLMVTDQYYGHTGGFPGIGDIVYSYRDGYRMILLTNLDASLPAAMNVLKAAAGESQ